MAEDSTDAQAAPHRQMAAATFNYTWDLLEKPDRTPVDDDTMLHAAHASRYHWGIVGAPVNLARGEWQVSRVYAVLRRAEPALYHARRCLALCEEHGIGDFDLAFAYEAMARALAVAGEVAASQEYLQRAQAATEQIAGPDDRALVSADLATIPPLYPV